MVTCLCSLKPTLAEGLQAANACKRDCLYAGDPANIHALLREHPRGDETDADPDLLTMPPTNAPAILRDAAQAIDARATLRDCPSGERSMARTVAAFNALYGHALTETQGWQFMSLLKKARASAGAHHLDDYTDDSAYAALAGESAERGA